MDDLNKYMNNVSTISALREKIQVLVDAKETYLKQEPLKILSAVELEDNKKMTDSYKEAVDRNNMLMDFVMEIKNEIFKMKLIKESIDRNTQVGLNQLKVIDSFINILNDILNIMYDEKSKLDRIVRYYEKTFNYYNVY